MIAVEKNEKLRSTQMLKLFEVRIICATEMNFENLAEIYKFDKAFHFLSKKNIFELI